MVVGDFAAVLEPGREGFNDRERCIGSGPGFVDGIVGDRIHFGQGLGEGGAVVDIEEIMTCHGVAWWVADGDGRDDSCGVVVVIVLVAGDLERHAWRIRLWDVFVAVVVEVRVLFPIIVDL